MTTNLELNQILTGYLKKDYVNYNSLEDIPSFKKSFCKFLQEQMHVEDNILEESYKRWCNQLSHGRAFPEIRRMVVYILRYHCRLKQYHIAHLLSVNTRTIRRDMRKIEEQIRIWY